MSDTTKRSIPTDLMDTGTRWADRVDATHLTAKPVPYHAARANLRTAEGGVERETTNSPAETGAGCKWRKSALKLWWFWVALAVFALPGIYLFGMVEGLLLYIPCVVAGCLLAEFWVLPLIETWRTDKQRASGGEGV